MRILEILAIGVIILLFLTIPGMIIVAIVDESKEVLLSEYDIVQMKLLSNTSGSFFLGTGSISGSLYYWYYVSTDDGLRLRRASWRSSSIIITKDEPCVKCYGTPMIRKVKRCVFYVPEGSVAHDFDLNLGRKGKEPR